MQGEPDIDAVMAQATPITKEPPRLTPIEQPKPEGDLGRIMEKKIALPGVTMGDRGLDPKDMDELQRVAALYLASGMVPESIIKTARNEKEALARVSLILEQARVLSIPNSAALQGMCIVRNVVAIWGDLMQALAVRHPDFAGINVEYAGEGDRLVCKCTIKRMVKGVADTYVASFGIEDAKQAGLLGKDVWKSYTKDMLRNRARSRAIRFLFPDALCGLASAEELTDADISAAALAAEQADKAIKNLA
jgi:hypothetical protein